MKLLLFYGELEEIADRRNVKDRVTNIENKKQRVKSNDFTLCFLFG